jgi:uncharacterized protein YabN with tetrapyrrole methylase and pyrophosphatase domain
MKRKPAINQLLAVMAKLRSPKGCPWDREQDHMTLRRHAVEEVYELIDAIEARDDHEMAEELGDLLLQVVFHCQLARERDAFNFEQVTQHLVDKLIRRHPHVFGQIKVKNVDEVWTNWEQIKKTEKHGTKHQRNSALDGIPKHLPTLLRAEKLIKKGRKASLLPKPPAHRTTSSKAVIATRLLELVETAQSRGWSAEELLADKLKSLERTLRRRERAASTKH